MRTNKKIASNLEKHILYISVGAKEHFYTLRKMVIDRSGSTWDDYICNLATSKEEAITKAQECFSKIKKHVGNQDIDLSLSLEPEFTTSQHFKSRKALSDDRLNDIENGTAAKTEEGWNFQQFVIAGPSTIVVAPRQ